MTPNVGGWYKRKWRVATKITEEEARWRKEVWIPLSIALIILAWEIYFFYFR